MAYFTDDDVEKSAQIIRQAVRESDIDFLEPLNNVACRLILETLKKAADENLTPEVWEHTEKSLATPHASNFPSLFTPIVALALMAPRGSTFHLAAMAYKAHHQVKQSQLLTAGIDLLIAEILEAEMIPKEHQEDFFNTLKHIAIRVPIQENGDHLVQFLKEFNAPKNVLQSPAIKFFERYRKESRDDLDNLKALPSADGLRLKESVVVIGSLIARLDSKNVNPEDTAVSYLINVNYNDTTNRLENLFKKGNIDYTNMAGFEAILDFYNRYQRAFS